MTTHWVNVNTFIINNTILHKLKYIKYYKTTKNLNTILFHNYDVLKYKYRIQLYIYWVFRAIFIIFLFVLAIDNNISILYSNCLDL